MVNGQLVIVFISLGEGVSHNTIFTCPFLQTVKSSIMNEDNTLVSGILGDHCFKYGKPLRYYRDDSIEVFDTLL